MKFEVKEITKNVISWIKIQLKNSDTTGCVVGISGGKDSACVLALLVKALGKDNVIGVLMPNGVQEDLEDSKKLVKHFGVTSYECNMENAYKSLVNELPTNKEEAIINVLPRLRMTTLYAIASENEYLVVGTSNLSEIHIGYNTKWGDLAYDFNPIAMFTTKEVIEIGEYLKVPKDILNKTPRDEISGKTDEEKIGFSYNELNKYLRENICSSRDLKENIDLIHNKTKHKREKPPVFKH